jgi:hypothetical protein
MHPTSDSFPFTGLFYGWGLSEVVALIEASEESFKLAA